MSVIRERIIKTISESHGTKSVCVQEYELGVASAVAGGCGQMRVSVDCIVIINICYAITIDGYG